MGTGGGPRDPEEEETPFNNPEEDPVDGGDGGDGGQQLRTIAILFNQGGTDQATHGTVTDFDDTPENAGDNLVTTLLQGAATTRYRFVPTAPDGAQPITLSTISANTTIPTRIEVFEVDGNGARTRVANGDGNELGATETQSAINHQFTNGTNYDIDITNRGGNPGAYSLSMNYTKNATAAKINPQLFTLDNTNIWTDAMVTEVNAAATKWGNVITEMPGINGDTRTLPVNISFQDTGDVFADTNVYETSTDGFNNTLFRRYSTKARVRVNTARYATDWNNALAGTEADNTDSHALEDIVKREFGKSLGIGGQFWERNPNEVDNFHTNNIWLNGGQQFPNSYNTRPIQRPIPAPQGVTEAIQDDKNYLLYVGQKALNVYTTIHDVGGGEPTINGQETDYEFDLGEFKNAFDAIIAPSTFDSISADLNDANKVGTFMGIPVVSGRNMPFEGAHINPVPNGGGYLVVGSEGAIGATEVQTGIVRLINNMHLGLGDEIMTSFFEPFADRSRVNGSQQQPHPISAISVGFLEDLGYTVDYGGAEPYSLGGNGQYNAILADPEGANPN